MKDEKQYLAEPSKCPKCNATDVSGGVVDIDGSVAEQDIYCLVCGFEYTDHYALTHFVPMYPPKPEDVSS